MGTMPFEMWRALARDSIAVNTKDSSVLVRVPSGEFEMGDGSDSQCPKHRVYLTEYWINVYTVSNRQYARFLAETKHQPPDQTDYGDPVWKNGQCPAEILDHPVVNVDWNDATAYAKWAGLSLPTEAQWEKAARCPQGLIYPWGNEWDEKCCRHNTNKGIEETAASWVYPGGVSGTGTYQQSGNVLEWCADWYQDGYYTTCRKENPKGARSGIGRVIRGGCWGGR
jgi:sulfatase modifying factor 1